MTARISKATGWDVSPATVTPAPFHFHARPPDVKPARMAPKDPNARQQAIGENEVASPLRHHANRAPPVTTVQWNIGVKLRESSLVARLGADCADDPVKGYRGLLDNPAYFKFGTSGPAPRRASSVASAAPSREAVEARARLAAQLESVREHLGDNPALPPEVRGAEMVVITQALSLAVHGHDPALAARGLACLRGVDLHASIAHSDTAPPAGFNEAELACAWRIAQALEKSPLGFGCLKRIARTPHGGRPAHASVASHDDAMLRVFLKASREKTRLDKHLHPHPRGVLGEIPDLPGTLLDKSLRAVQAHLLQSRAHAHARPGAPFHPVKDSHEWAIGAVDNGYYSDQRKDAKGRTTPFHKADERLKKMGKWVFRASGANNADPDGSTPDTAGRKVPAARKARRARGERARRATVEIGTGAQGNELFLGTQRMPVGQAGAILWASGDRSIGMAGRDRNGVVIRFERISGGAGADKADNERLERVAAKLMAPGAPPEGEPYANASGEDGASPLKNLFQEWPGASVGLVQSKDKAGHANGPLSGGIGARFGNVRLGLGGSGVGIAGRFRGGTSSTETGGTLRVDRRSRFWSVKASVPAPAGALDLDGSDLDRVLGAGEAMGVNVGLWKNGDAQTDTLIEYQGELRKNSVRIKTYQTFVDQAGPPQPFREFKEIRAEAAAVANAVQSVATMAGECGDRTAVKECGKYRRQLLDSEEAWEPAFPDDTRPPPGSAA